MASQRHFEEEDMTEYDVMALDNGHFDYVRFTVADINGVSRSKTIPKEHVKEFLKNGVTLFAGALAFGLRGEVCTLREVTETRHANVYVRPMPGTIHRVPWASSKADVKIGQFLCETFWTSPYRDGGHQAACPRYIARRQLNRLKSLGYDLYSSFEAEFCVYEEDRETPLYSDNGIFSDVKMDRHGDLLYEMERNLRAGDIDVQVFHAEYGPGQFEMALQPQFGIDAADQMFRLKDGVKAIAYRNAKFASFMTKPVLSAVGSGLHYNHSIWSNNSQINAFYDPEKPDGLSTVAKSWIAGLVKHAPAIAALCSPTVNCYRRFHTPSVPSKANWGIEDRNSSFRVKNHGPKETYVENRLPSSAANPYLVLAATVAAGIDGLVNHLECPPAEQSDAALPLAKSLEESLKFLEQDEVITGALGDEFIRWFTIIKRETEIKKSAELDFNSKEAFEKEKEMYFQSV